MAKQLFRDMSFIFVFVCVCTCVFVWRVYVFECKRTYMHVCMEARGQT